MGGLSFAIGARRQGLAPEAEFCAQAAKARGVLDWYSLYTRVLARLMGRTPSIVSGFCGGGGSDEGIRRAGMVSHGIDWEEQPDYDSAELPQCHISFVQGSAGRHAKYV